MQAYGFGIMFSFGPADMKPVYAFWPLEDAQHKAIQPPKDLLSKNGGVFARIHPTFTDAVSFDSTKNLIVVVDGRSDQIGTQNGYSNVSRVCKNGDIIYSFTYRQTSYNRWSFAANAYRANRPNGTYDAKLEWGWYRSQSFTSAPGPMSQATLDVLIALYAQSPMWTGSYLTCTIGLTNCSIPAQSNLDTDAGTILTEFEHHCMFNSFYSPFFTTGTQQAYTLAAAGLPKVASNAIANIVDVIGSLAGVLRGDLSSVARAGKTAGDAWLTYRYAYSTTMLDVDEYKRYFKRIETITDDLARQTVTSRGVFTRDGWTFRCSMEIRVTDFLPTELSEQIKNLGLQLNAMNAWDMVPFSFIADWFLPIGDIIEAFQSRNEAAKWRPTSCWFSVASPLGKHYLRTPGKWQAAMPVGHSSEVSDKTFWFRVADTVALLKG